MEWESDSHWGSHTYPRQVRSFPGRLSSWELGFRDCGAIPGQGLLLTAERQIEGIWGRILWWEMSVKESQAAMEARRYCWVTHRGWSHHHSLSFPTCQNQQLNNREADPPDALNYRVGPHPGCFFKCLTRQPTEEDPTQGGPSIYDEVPNKRKGQPGKGVLSVPEPGRATEKDWAKRPSDCRLQEARKKTLKGP